MLDKNPIRINKAEFTSFTIESSCCISTCMFYESFAQNILQSQILALINCLYGMLFLHHTLLVTI